MRFVIVIAATVPALMLSMGSHAQQVLGLRFKTPDGRVSVWMPAPPRTTTDVISGQDGRKYERTTHVIDTSNYTLIVGVVELSGRAPTTGDEDYYLDAMRESLQAGLGDRFVLDAQGGETDLKPGADGLRGRQIKATVDGQRMIMRSYVGLNRIYSLQVGYRVGDKASEALGERFLGSLSIRDAGMPANKPPR